MNSFSNLLCRVKPLSLFQNISKIRHLYSSASIGLDDYIASRKHFDKKYELNSSKFRKEMQEFCKTDALPTAMVFTEDLKRMLYVANDNPEDIQLVEKMITKYNSKTNLRFTSFSFGPVIMRLFHYLNKPEEALKVYKNEDLSRLFDQLSSHVILMDLLFKNKMYHDVIEVYKIARDKQLAFGSHQKSIIVLVFGAYYKLNTQQHFEEALKLYGEMVERGYTPLRRTSAFLAALALNQNNPHASLEVIVALPNQKYVYVRCIKALAFCNLDRTQDAVSVIKTVLQQDGPKHGQIKHTFPRDVVEKVREAVDRLGSKQLITDYNRIFNQLTEQGHIIEKTLDDLLCSEVVVTPSASRLQTTLNVAMDKSNINHKKDFRYRRTGLDEVM